MKTARIIEEGKERNKDSVKAPNSKRGQHPNSRANLIAPWKPGVSANPGGKPGCDVAAVLARRVIEDNQEEIYKGMAEQLINGNCYAFDVVANRAFGKIKESIEFSGTIRTLSDEELRAKLIELTASAT